MNVPKSVWHRFASVYCDIGALVVGSAEIGRVRFASGVCFAPSYSGAQRDMAVSIHVLINWQTPTGYRANGCY